MVLIWFGVGFDLLVSGSGIWGFWSMFGFEFAGLTLSGVLCWIGRLLV